MILINVKLPLGVVIHPSSSGSTRYIVIDIALTMMSLFLRLFLALLVLSSVFADECNCDAAIAAAKEQATQERSTLTTQLTDVSAQLQKLQSELVSCQTKASERPSVAELKQQMEQLKAEASELQKVQKELSDAKKELNDVTTAREEMKDKNRAEFNQLDALYQEATEMMKKAQENIAEATDQMRLLEEMKSKSYINFGSLWGDFFSAVTGKKAGIDAPPDADAGSAETKVVGEL
jgi:peptidoglycan hydrolase CwlO-like protein